MKNYQAQTSQNLVLTQIFQNVKKRSTSQESDTVEQNLVRVQNIGM